jgi:hypothetical protein
MISSHLVLAYSKLLTRAAKGYITIYTALFPIAEGQIREKMSDLTSYYGKISHSAWVVLWIIFRCCET